MLLSVLVVALAVVGTLLLALRLLSLRTGLGTLLHALRLLQLLDRLLLEVLAGILTGVLAGRLALKKSLGRNRERELNLSLRLLLCGTRRHTRGLTSWLALGLLRLGTSTARGLGSLLALTVLLEALASSRRARTAWLSGLGTATGLATSTELKTYVQNGKTSR